jgi:protein-S-isoprenylcysteine O-methyltransferase Ste14
MATRSVASRHTDRSVLSSSPVLPRLGILVFGIASYLLGFASLVLVILASLGVYAFTGGPVHLASPIAAALFNLGLLVLFGVQHSVMARAWFKQRWTRIIHPAMERSTFLLATAAVLLPLVVLWQPVPGVVWSLPSPLARTALTGTALLGWAYLFAATFAIDHLELFGLRQSWRGFREQPTVPVPFRERWMYRIDRHPIMTGVLVGLWATPDMTVGRLLFAAGLSAYVLVGVHFEERALERQLGDVYRSYRRRVPALVPSFGARSSRSLSATTIVAAPPAHVWALMADVTRWPEWLQTMSSVQPLDTVQLTIGARYRIAQPRLRPTVWTVTGLEPMRSFSWESRSPGVRVVADHRLAPLPDGSTSVTLQIRFLGPLSMLARVLGGSLAAEYLAREAAALTLRVESHSSGGAMGPA